MDRHVPPQITYWTGLWQPGREALSNEVQALRDLSGRASPVVSFSRGQRSSVSFEARVVRLSANRWVTLRMLAAALEPYGSVTHVFGALDEWHLLRAVGRRPIVFTVALPGAAVDPTLFTKVTMFVAETEPLAEALIGHGVPRGNVCVISPGVDLVEYAPRRCQANRRFRILFASTPADPAEFSRRGIPFIVDLARRRPDIEVVLLWREWGDEESARRALAALAPPDNVTVEMRGARSMADVYASANATICCYEAGFGKSCPNSIVESLACGRPVLMTDTCGLASCIRGNRAGVVFPRTVEAANDAIDELQSDYQTYAARARQLAVRRFDLQVFRASYAEVYAKVASGHLS